MSITRTAQGRQLEALVHEILGAFFGLRSVGQTLGLVTEWGAGSWGLLRMLVLEGPRTVPEIARMRGVSRQYVQKLANELVAEGLVELADNPAHKRSKLLQLTTAGKSRYESLNARFVGHIEALAPGFGLVELTTTIETIAKLRQHLHETSQDPGRR